MSKYARLSNCYRVLVYPGLLLLALASFPAEVVLAADESTANDADTTAEPDSGDIPAGHSQHGQAFNEGPRQQAYLMSGTGAVHLAVTTSNPTAQKFIDQGVGQLHGFWYFEAERSFRQAAMLDPDCAMAYWGMAKANHNNKERSKAFIAAAIKRMDRASPREQMYIKAFDDYIHDRPDGKQRKKKYIAAIEKLVKDYPDDLEAKALLGYIYYRDRSAAGKKHEQVDTFLKEVLAKQPLHPVHHYRIHLWDFKDPKRALDSSAACGEAAPAIAHMWHMPGHIYSRLKRYDDAVWQQEASARVDHSQMMRDRVLPDQIHNFAHNNEWLIRNLGYIGRHQDAMQLAMNMIQLPRHPKYNALKTRHSAYYGRRRLFDVLYNYELWPQLIDRAKGAYLEPTEIEAEQIKRLRYLGVAYARNGDKPGAEQVLTELRQRQAVAIEKLEKEKSETAEDSSQPKEKTTSQESSPRAEDASRQPGSGEAEQSPAKQTTPPQNTDAEKEKVATNQDDPNSSEAVSQTDVQATDQPAGESPNQAGKPSGSQDEGAADEATDKPESEQTDEQEPATEKAAAIEAADEKAAADKAAAEKAAAEKAAAEKAAEKKAADEKAAAEKAAAKKAADAKAAADKAKKARVKAANDLKNSVDRAVAIVEGYLAAAAGDYKSAVSLLKKGGETKRLQAHMQARAGDHEAAIKLAQAEVKAKQNQVLALATFIEILWLADRKFEAAKSMNRLREVSGAIQPGSPVFQRIDAIAKEMDLPEVWRIVKGRPQDFGARPELDALGPFRWRPSPAADWSLLDKDKVEHSLQQFRGTPLLVIFYLGYGCLHCAEQLQAFAPAAEKFTEAGISLIALSTDDLEGLKKSHKNYEGTFPFPLVANDKLDVFKAYRAFDDFEDQPLHGTFLIDPDGLVLWQDISYEPFMDVQFLLKESQRLLAQSKPAEGAKKPEIADTSRRLGSAEPSPEDRSLERIDPTGIRGALVIGGGGTMPDSVRRAFVQLAGGDDARIVILSPRQGDAVKARREVREIWQTTARSDVSVWLPRAEGQDAIGKLAASVDRAVLQEATGVWIDMADAEQWLPEDIQQDVLAVLSRDGVVGCARSIPLARAGDRAAAIDQRFDIMPGTVVRSAGAGGNSNALAEHLQQHPGLVGFEISAETAIAVRGRSMKVVGSGNVVVRWAAALTHAPTENILRDNDRADFVALRRSARSRTQPPFPAAKPGVPHVDKGTLVIVGGGGLPKGLTQRFIELAGGRDARIVVLPTATPGPDRGAGLVFERAGARNVKVLSARTLAEVEDPKNLEILRGADALWFGGGRQWRFVDAYEGTKAEALMHDVLRRGGVIGGSSAGASIQAEYLARGNPLGNLNIMAAGYDRGLGFLKGVAIDQHFSQRRRFADMISLVKRYPQLLGIGIDETTALVVQGNIAEVVGEHSVHFYDAAAAGKDSAPRHDQVEAGKRYDLKLRQIVAEDEPTAEGPADKQPLSPPAKEAEAALRNVGRMMPAFAVSRHTDSRL